MRSTVYQPLAYALMRWRTAPPSSWYTGMPSALALMSMQAISSVAIADMAISPTRA